MMGGSLAARASYRHVVAYQCDDTRGLRDHIEARRSSALGHAAAPARRRAVLAR